MGSVFSGQETLKKSLSRCRIFLIPRVGRYKMYYLICSIPRWFGLSALCGCFIVRMFAESYLSTHNMFMAYHIIWI